MDAGPSGPAFCDNPLPGRLVKIVPQQDMEEPIPATDPLK
jgi:hypothetical protein